ncbi:MAG: hypothetical protein U0K29_03880 [Prevotella sp.]|nr:hypothetical protein [Prevotella sp.]
MRTLRSILLAGTMLLATPMFFSSCEEEGSLIKFKTEVQVVNDFNDVVKAINDGKLSSEQAIAQLVTAIDNIKGDQNAKLQAITDALSNKNNTLDTKLNVIAGTMKSLSTEMPTKIDALAKAVENMPEYYEVLKAVETAIVNINPNEQLKLLEGVLDKYCNDELINPEVSYSYKGKLYFCIAEIEDTLRYMTYKDDKFKAIRKAIEALAGENAKLDVILDNMTKIVQAIMAGNTNEKEGWAEIARQLALLKAAAGIGGSTDNVEYVDLGLPSGNLWATCNLGASTPEAYGDYYAWGETKPKKEYTYPNHKWYKEGAPSLGFTKYNNEDGKLTLEDEDDAVIQNLGNGWRTPTLADFRELTNQKLTTIKKTTLNGVAGYQITSKKNKKSIFIPCAGFKQDKPKTREISSSEEVAICMTNLRRIDDKVFNAWSFAFEQDCIARYGKRRPDGISVRPVKGPGMPVPNNCVDLGLNSGLLWAKCNMGTTDPTQPGDYYAWGETSTKKEYSAETYKHYKWADYKLKRIKKYNAEDGKTVIDPDDDAARVNLGVGYRIPTQEDWKELLDECNWQAVTITLPEIMDPSQTKTIARWKVTGPSGNSIILPMTGGFEFAGGYSHNDKNNTYYTTANLSPAEKLPDDDKYREAVALTWPFFAESDGSVEYPSFASTRRVFGIVVRPVFDLYSNK